MSVCGLKSVLAVTILGLVVACNSDYTTPLESAKVAGGGLDAAFQGVGGEGNDDLDTVFSVQPALQMPTLDIQVISSEQHETDSNSTEQNKNLQNEQGQASQAGDTPQVDEGSEAAASQDQELTEQDEPNQETGPTADGEDETSEDGTLGEQAPENDTTSHTVTVSGIENWNTLEMPARLAALLSRARLDCSLSDELKGYCQSTALVLSLDHDQEGGVQALECTAQYIGNNTLVTAAHCVPQDVLDGESGCTDRMAFGFYQENQSELLPASCVSLKEHFRYYKEEGEDQTERVPDLRRPDVAFLEIQFAEGEGQVVKDNALNLSREGFLPENTFHFVSITPFSGERQGGVISMKDCKAYENTVILDGHRDYRSETVVLMGDNCSAPPGNSGAVVISHDTGEVVGSVHAYLDDAAQKYEGLGYRLSDEGALNPVVVTNFSCLLSDVVEASSAISGCDNVDRVVAQKRRSSWQQISMDYENALQSSEQEAQALFDTSAVEISHLLEVEAFRENESPLFSPLRRNFETLVPKFLCHAQSAPASTISFNAAEREVFQYLDKTLRIKAKKVVEPKAKNYSLQPVGGSYLRITESDSGQASDLPLCN